MWGFRQNVLGVPEPVLSVVEGFAVLVSDANLGFDIAADPPVVTFVFPPLDCPCLTALPPLTTEQWARDLCLYPHPGLGQTTGIGLPLFDNFLFQRTLKPNLPPHPFAKLFACRSLRVTTFEWRSLHRNGAINPLFSGAIGGGGTLGRAAPRARPSMRSLPEISRRMAHPSRHCSGGGVFQPASNVRVGVGLGPGLLRMRKQRPVRYSES